MYWYTSKWSIVWLRLLPLWISKSLIDFGLFGGRTAITSLESEIYFLVIDDTLIPDEEIWGDCIDFPSYV